MMGYGMKGLSSRFDDGCSFVFAGFGWCWGWIDWVHLVLLVWLLIKFKRWSC